MLPRSLRVTSSSDHRDVSRRGRRAATSRLVVHLLTPVGEVAPATDDTVVSAAPARAGVVVGRPVGNAVVRHRVARRLRHLLGPRLAAVPTGSLLVVRARPGAGSVSSRVLGADLDDVLARVVRPPRRSRGHG